MANAANNRIVQASQTRLTVCSDRGCHLWVSTDLETVQPDNPEDQSEDITLDGRVYRRLSPDYYLWLKARFEKFQTAIGKADSSTATADEHAAAFIRRFEALRASAQAHYSLADLKEAKKRLTAFPFVSPNKPVRQEPTPAFAPANTQKPAKPSFLFPPDGDAAFDPESIRFTSPVTPHALDQVNRVRDEALAAGWTLPELFQNRGRLRFPYGQDWGIACFIDPGQRLGAVAPDKIELICRGGHSLYFRRRGREHLPGTRPNHSHANQEAARS